MDSLPPEVQAIEIALGNWRAQALRAMVQTGLADAMDKLSGVDEKMVCVEDIARQAGTQPEATRRLLRYVSTFNVCVEGGGSVFKLGPIGKTLTSMHPKSVAGRILLEAGETHTMLWTHLSEFVFCGKKVIQSAFGVPDYFGMMVANPDHLKTFQEAMTSYSNEEGFFLSNPELSPTFDFSSFKTICDLGCAEGALAKALAFRYPEYEEWILADLHESLDRIDISSMPERFRKQACDFFVEGDIPKADAYVLKHIIHDWDDECSSKILTNIRAANESAVVYIIEFGPMPGPNVPHMSKGFDLHMGQALGAKERNQEEYDELFGANRCKRVSTHLLAGGAFPLYVQEVVFDSSVEL